jgi:hypothetical protein
MSDPVGIFEHLVSERGGRENLSVVDLAVARRLAQQLAADEGNPAAIASLMSMLPSPTRTNRAQARPRPDLSLLTDEQLHELEVLMCIATGEKPPDRPVASARRVAADNLLALVDGAERDGSLDTEEVRISIRNLIEVILSPVLPMHLYGITNPQPALQHAEEDNHARPRMQG